MSLPKASQCWRIPDELWAKVQPLLPPGKPHPLGCHRPRVDDRKAMDAIFYRLRTGCQWKALDATGICSGSSAHRRFQEWTHAGVFKMLWTQVYPSNKVLQNRGDEACNYVPKTLVESFTLLTEVPFTLSSAVDCLK